MPRNRCSPNMYVLIDAMAEETRYLIQPAHDLGPYESSRILNNAMLFDNAAVRHAWASSRPGVYKRYVDAEVCVTADFDAHQVLALQTNQPTPASPCPTA